MEGSDDYDDDFIDIDADSPRPSEFFNTTTALGMLYGTSRGKR